MPEFNPLSWIYGLPFALACLCVCRLPTQSQLKLAMRKVLELEAQVMANLFSSRFEFCEVKAHRRTQVLFSCLTVALFAMSAASFATWLQR